MNCDVFTRKDIKCCNSCRKNNGNCEVLHWCGNTCEYWEAPTNADHIRSMTDEELAMYLGGLFQDLYEDGVGYSMHPWRWLEWLKQPHKEGEGK